MIMKQRLTRQSGFVAEYAQGQNKEMIKLRAENKRLKKKLKNCVCPNCGFGFEQAPKEN